MTNRTFILSSGREVTLSENEQVILDRMQEPDGREFEMVFKGPVDSDVQRGCPKDQGEGLMIKGLTYALVGVDSHGVWGMTLTDDGREVQAQMHPQPVGDQYAELHLDDLINLAAQICEPGRVVTPQVVGELTGVVRAIKARHDETSLARRRVGEYLRQTVLRHERSEQNKSYSQPRGQKYVPDPLDDKIDTAREDPYAGAVTLRRSDLAQLAPVAVRDTKAEFFAEQERRLAILMEHEGAKLPEKQKALLPCLAKGHFDSSYEGTYSGTSGCCFQVDGRTLNALAKKDFVGSIPKMTIGRGSVLIIKKPVEG